MFILVRAATYATLFVGFLLLFLPARILSQSGIAPPAIGLPQVIGMVIGGTGAALALSCIVVYTGLFMLITHLVVVFYEEPALQQSFGHQYDTYCGRVSRWWPRPRQSGD